MALDPVPEQAHQQPDVALEAHPPADLHEVLAPYRAELGIVTQKIGQLAALLDQVGAGQAGDLLRERRAPDELAQDEARVVEAQRLIEVAREQEFLGHGFLSTTATVSPTRDAAATDDPQKQNPRGLPRGSLSISAAERLRSQSPPAGRPPP